MSEQENKEVVEPSQETEKVVPLALSAKVRVNGRLLQTDLNPEAIYKEWPEFGPGDTVKVHYKIKEGDKERVQPYEGVVISVRGEGLGKTFMVRRISHEVGVERVFPYHSPSIANLEVVRRGLVRRSKLFYLRYKSGKESRIKESFEGKDKAVAEKKKAQAKERAKKAKAQKEG